MTDALFVKTFQVALDQLLNRINLHGWVTFQIYLKKKKDSVSTSLEKALQEEWV